MERKVLNSWEDWQLQLEEIRNKHSKSLKPRVKSPLFFRGQANSAWALATTLERRVLANEMPLAEYYATVCEMWCEIQQHAPDTVTAPAPYPEIESTLRDSFELFDLPASDYLIFLRHHGFPSPLLDWSVCPDVAAYFAFSHIPKCADAVSIYVFCELPQGRKTYWNSRPHIINPEAISAGNPRHVGQRGEYTMCVVPAGSSWNVVSHDNVFDAGLPGEDLLVKFDLPATERAKVLATLEARGIDAFSLFGSVDSLMERMATRYFPR
jgi:FRG domain